jgi:hypothetical protein
MFADIQSKNTFFFPLPYENLKIQLKTIIGSFVVYGYEKYAQNKGEIL